MKNALVFVVALTTLSSGVGAWDVVPCWTRQLDAASMSATGVFDLDQDGVPELLVPGNARLYCYDTSGVLRWSFRPLSSYFPAVSSALAADINHDGAIEVLVSTPAAIYALSASGDSLWRRTLGGQGSVQNCISSLALADINHDRELEIFGYEIYNNRLLCLNPRDGDTLWSYVPSGSAFFSIGTPTVADLDCDGRYEILGQVSFSSGGGQLYCLSDSGQERWHYDTPGSGIGGWQLASAAVADVNGDSILEVISTANYWGIFCLTASGSEKWRVRLSEHEASYPAIGDIDRDGVPEVVVGSGPNMRCYNANTGSLKWSFPVANGYYIVSSPCLADLDGDGQLEVIFAEVKQNNPDDPNRPMWVLSSQGQAIWNDTVGTTMSDAFAGDINHDCKVEFGIGPTYRGYNFWLYQADTAAVTPGRIDWPTLQHDLGRTGWYDYGEPSSRVGEPARQLSAIHGLRAEPNPFVHAVEFSSPVCLEGPLVLGIFDINGRRVRTLLLSASGIASWDGTSESGQLCPPGLYYGCLSGGDRRSVVRVVKLGR